MDTSKLIGVADAARVHNLSDHVLRRRLREANVPTIVMPQDERRRFIRREDLERALQPRELRGNPDDDFGDAA